jgi:pSer/pThr/pTyr-binding forkhead associated (FHA) protein
MKRLSIGRDSSNDIVIEDNSVSRNHGILEIEDDEIYIVDNYSSNGITVNGKKIQKQKIKSKDVIIVGRVRVKLEGESLVPLESEVVDKTTLISRPGFDSNQNFKKSRSFKSLKPKVFIPLLVIALVLGLGIFNFNSLSSILGLKDTNNNSIETNEQLEIDSKLLFTQPEDLQTLISKIKLSTVTIYCGESTGTAWASWIPVANDKPSTYKTVLVTNWHVIENCDKAGSLVDVEGSNGARSQGEVLKVDKENDLALVLSEFDIPKLQASKKPEIGYWVMAAGSPYGISGTITFGNISNFKTDIIVTDAAINPGNSGGPLVLSDGTVAGINSAKITEADNTGFAIGVQYMCSKLISCKDKPIWQ